MIATFIETNLLIKGAQFAIDARPNEPVTRQLCDLFFELAFAPADNRRQDHDPLAFGQHQNVLQNLIDALSGNRRATLRAMRQSDR